jgi:3-oxoacid CoA-transferase subunit B
MDLATGAAGVIVAMEHTDRIGEPKIVEECTFPLTGKGCVYLIVTDLAVIECDGKGLTLIEVAPGWTPEEVQQLTGAKLTISPDVGEFQL